MDRRILDLIVKIGFIERFIENRNLFITYSYSCLITYSYSCYFFNYKIETFECWLTINIPESARRSVIVSGLSINHNSVYEILLEEFKTELRDININKIIDG